MPWWDRDDDDEEHPEISRAWYAKHGTLAVPPEHIKQAWRAGKTGLEPDRRTVSLEQARRTRLHAEGVHPTTGRFSAPWKKPPTGDGMRAQIRSRWRPGSESAKRAGRKRSYFKTLSARVNGRKGGLIGGRSRSPHKVAASRLNGARGGRPRRVPRVPG